MMNKHINVAVAGATGYIGLELIKLLINQKECLAMKISYKLLHENSRFFRGGFLLINKMKLLKK